MSANILELLKKIDRLTAKEKRVFETELQKRREVEWAEALVDMRKRAADRGITQKDIDRACDEVRYGSRPRRK